MSDTRYHGRNPQWDPSGEAEAPDPRMDPAQTDDPLAELARLIDEDPFADFSRQRTEPEAPADSDYYAEPSVYDYPEPAPDVTRSDEEIYAPYADEAAAQGGEFDFGEAETNRLYAELAAATERVEPSFDAPRYSSFPAPGREPAVESDEFGDRAFSAGAVADGETYAEGVYADEPALDDQWNEDPQYADAQSDPAYDDIYAETDPGFDQTGHYAPYDGELVHEPKSNRRRALMIAGSLVGLVVVGGAGVVGYGLISGGGSDAPPPVIRAERSPVKIQPPAQETDQASAQTPGKLVYDRVGGESGGEERLVSREEPVADVGDRPVRRIDPNQEDGLRGTAGEATSEDLPRRVRTVVVRPDGTIVGEVAPPQPAAPLQPAPLPGSAAEPAPSAAATADEAPAQDAPAATDSAEVPLPTPRPADLQRSSQATQPAAAQPAPVAAAQPAPVAAAPAPAQPGAGFVPPSAPQSGQPIQLQPTAVASLPAASAPPPVAAPASPAPAAPAPAAAAAPATGSFPPGSYVVQVAASRNEQDARSTAASISQRYSGALGSYAPVVERADLGDRGIYYRVGLGPMSSQSDAGSLCAQLKSSGLDCFVRRN